MNPGTITFSTLDGLTQGLSPHKIVGTGFDGWALSPHLDKQPTRSGGSMTRRRALAEAMYRYRYQGEASLLPPIASCFALAVRTLFPQTLADLDGLVMVPPPLNRTDYAPVVALVSEISRLTGIPSLQFAVRDVQNSGDRQTGHSGRSFAFSSPDTAAAFSGKQVLVIDDIYRSGRSLNRFCLLIKNEGGAAGVTAIVGTVVEKT
jgi:predicted amidophosphoribosyltransferase